ncbi:MAG: T9SS type A sorting domain-containing protein [Bacteroidetes bacterium]|nr:T9SS type A sorting domain-containing protein [Bacteroidota bacterium]
MISGSTYSIDFPVTAGAFQTTQNGDIDSFVWQIDSTSIITTIPSNNSEITAYLYPNPANEKIIIAGLIPGVYNLIIWDGMGKMVLQRDIECQNEIHLEGLESLSAGLYHISLIINDKKSYFMLVKP